MDRFFGRHGAQHASRKGEIQQFFDRTDVMDLELLQKLRLNIFANVLLILKG